MSSPNLLDDFFNARPTVVDTTQNNLTEFRPNVKKGQGGVYKAVIRFLPNPQDPASKSIVSKSTVYLTNPVTQQKMEIDCPSSIGQPSVLQNTFFALRSSSNSILQENSKQFSRKQRYASLIQVISCEHEPTLVNKILVWRYGYKIHEKLMAEMNPPMGEPKNPFDPINGRPFVVIVKEVANYPNYDGCAFFDVNPPSSAAMRIIAPNAQGIPTVTVVDTNLISTPTGKQQVFDYLVNNAPSLEPYEYHPWTQEIEQFVNQCIQIYSSPQATINAMSAQQNPGQASIGQPMGQQLPGASPVVEGLSSMGNFPSASAQAPTAAPSQPIINSQPVQPVQPAAPQPSAPSIQVPTMGLDSGAVSQMDPRGFASSGLNSDVNSLINNIGQPSPAPSVPSGVDVADLINGVMV